MPEPPPSPPESRPAPVAAVGGLDSAAGWRVVAVAFVSMFTVFGVAYSFGAFFDSMASDFGSGAGATSAVFSITAFVYFLLGSLSGLAVDRVGPRRVLLVGALAMGVGLLLTSRVQSLWLGYLTYGLGVGIGVACGYVPMVATVSGWFDRKRGLALGLAVAGIGAGTVSMAPLAATLIDHYGWRTTYVVFGVGSTAVLALCALLVAPPPAAPTSSPPALLPAPTELPAPGPSPAAAPPPAAPPTAAPPTAPLPSSRWPTAIRTHDFRWFYASGVLLSLALFVPFVFLVPFAEDRGIGTVAAAGLVGFIGLSSIAGRLLIGAIADRVGAMLALRGCYVAMATSFAIWWAVDSYPGLVAFTVVIGAGYGGFVALSPAVIADLFGTSGLGGLIGLTYTGAAFGTLLGPPLAGRLIEATSYDTTIVACLAVGLASCVVLAMVGRPTSPTRTRAGTTTTAPGTGGAA